MRKSDFLDSLADRALACSPTHLPWLNWAMHAVDRGWYHLIGGRTDPDELYLARFWMTEPKLHDNPDSPCPFESQNSVLLHFFARGDDDGACHLHPWDFTTRILSGGYWETIPKPGVIKPYLLSGPQPSDLIEVYRTVGDSISHSASDFHAVAAPECNTWTLVTTGPRTSQWGFLPAGKPYVRHDVYLSDKYRAHEA